MDSKIFSLISRQDEKIKLWQDLGQSKTELICKGKEDAVCNLVVTFYNRKTQCLECSFKTSMHLKNREEYLGYFFLGGEKYYFQALAQVSQDKVVVPIPEELYHLQRRQNYRVHVPHNFSAFFNITQLNSLPQSISGTLADLSAQGCRAVYQSDIPGLKLGDSITASLVIEKRPPIEVLAKVRHVKRGDAGKASLVLGFEFTPITPVLENRLFAITLEIHKQLFRRFL